jgi:hypothetical protein
VTVRWTEGEKHFKEAFDRVELAVEGKFRIPVRIGDCRDPFTGDFNGEEIILDHAVDLEAALFILAHLFGHTVQWVTDPGLRQLGLTYATSAPPEHLRDAVRRYEQDASRLALSLFHLAGVKTLDGWLSDWAAADWRYLDHFYRTGARGDPHAFFVAGTPVLAPLPIPAFTPARFESRNSF